MQRDDNHIRVSAQLIETTDGTQLWAATYDRPESDIFAVQDAIATEVTRALSIALAGKAGLVRSARRISQPTITTCAASS